ncbi:MAG: hypothetical protein R2761_27455 [Acidimicrobiales bacterium]
MNRTERLIHPAVVGAVALLALNDHVLKPRWPGLITGKLSDVAGLFVVAVMSAVIVGPQHRQRSTIALAAAGVAFAALKLLPGVAELVSPVLGGTTIADPTDLVALAVLPLAHRLVRSQRTDRLGGAQVLAATLAVTAGTLSVTATSCLEAEGVTGFALVPDGVVAGVGESGGPATEYFSADSGRTWDIYDPPVARVGPPLVQPTQICLNDARCYRVAGNNRVEEQDTDGAWRTAFTFTDEQIRRMRLRADSCSGRGEPEHMFAFLTPTGPTSPSDPNPPTVLVSMGTQGILRLDPDTGRWQRLAVGRAEPLSLRGPSWLADLSMLPLLFLLITPALYFVHRGRRSRRRRIVLAAVATGVAAAIGMATLGVLVVTLGTADYAVFGTSVAVLSVAAFLASLAVALRSPRGDEGAAGR